MKQNIQLLIIDPQNDFCDLPASWQGINALTGQPIAPALPVTGAHANMLRLSELIQKAQRGISEIVITLDSHHRVDIAHPPFWLKADGSAVLPFTTITAQQFREGQYRCKDPSAKQRVQAYLDELDARGRYTLMVWPVHCAIGTWGHNIHTEVKSACNVWEEAFVRTVRYVHKGTNPWTEHYSAMQAEVPDSADPDTQLNQALLNSLDKADMILIAGEASSHCVKATTEDIANNLPSGRLERMVLLTDCISSVQGFESQARQFLEDMCHRGVNLTTSTDILPRVLRNA